LKKTVEQNY